MSRRDDFTAHLEGSECSPDELEAMWASLAPRAARTPRPRRPMRLFVAALGLGAAAATAAVLLLPRADSADGGSSMATSARATEFRLDDGSRVRLQPDSRVRVADRRAEAIALVLERGTAVLDVAKRPTRRFSVSVGRLTVAVVGTRFTVSVGDAPLGSARPVHVAVSHGVVEVRLPGEPTRRVGAGEAWTGFDAPAARSAEATSGPPAPQPSIEAQPGAQRAETHGHARPDARLDLRRGAPATPPRAQGAPSPAERLFEQADRAWVKGRPAEAARTLELLRRRFPSAPIAPLAALQLGRIRLDALDDPRGAIEALGAAARGLGETSLREDVDARMVTAWERLGDEGACVRARRRYLELYPRGHHVDAVKRRCRTP